MSRYVRIQVSGPFAELDYTVPEKKAPAELRKLKALSKSFITPVLEKWRDDHAYKKRTRWGWKKVRPRLDNYPISKTALILQHAGIEPTKITITTV